MKSFESFMAQQLNEYLLYRQNLGYSIRVSRAHLLIFDQQPIKPTLVQARLRRYGAAVGVAVSPHRLRHTLATRLVNAGMDIISIQRLLGHEKLDTTMIYAHVHDTTMEQDFRQAMARLAHGQGRLPMPAQLESGTLAEELFFHAPTSVSIQS